METISMEMMAPAVSQTGPPGSSPDTVQDASFGEMLAQVREETGTEVPAERAPTHVEQGPKTARDSLREGHPAGEKGYDSKVQEDAEDDASSVNSSGPMALFEVRTPGGELSEMPVLPDTPAPVPAKTTVDRMELPEGLPRAEKVNAEVPVRSDPFAPPTLEEEEPAAAAERHGASEAETTEVHRVPVGRERPMASSVPSREIGTRDVSLVDVTRVLESGSGEQSNAPPDRIPREREMTKVPELPKLDLRMPEHPSVTMEAGKGEWSRNRNLSSFQRREASLTEPNAPPGQPPQTDKETSFVGGKMMQPGDEGSLWLREGFAGTPPEGFFPTDGRLTVEGPEKGSAPAAPTFGEEPGQGLLEQVQSQLHRMAIRGREKITLQLHPESLGKLKMHVSMQNQHLVVEMTTDSAMTREILSRHVHTLKEALMDHGVRLERFDVHFQDNPTDNGSRHAGQAFQEQARQQQQGRAYYRTFPSEDVPVVPGLAEVAPVAAAMAASGPGINLFV